MLAAGFAEMTEVEPDEQPAETSPPGTARSRLRKVLPAAAFLGGFLWDAVTLGRSIGTIDLVILLGYYIAAAVILVLIGRSVRFRFSRYLNYALQFLFGGIFSALVIFYFLSSSVLPGFTFVSALLMLLVANEFLEKRYAQLTLSWTLFTACGIMLFNFVLPHAFRSINPAFFYLSTLLALAATAIVRILSRQETARLWPAGVVATALLVLHAVNAIPPVPLVKKQMLIAHSIERKGGEYRLTVEPRTPLERLRLSGATHRREGGRIYCFTSVFAPGGMQTVLSHRWEKFDPATKRWETMSRVSFPLSGGRREGYRGYSWKQNVSPGEWRIRAELPSGATVGILRFRIADEQPRPFRTIRL